MITEIGGTVGDIESLPFLEAARQVRHDVGRDNCFFLHVSLVPYLAPSGELKTKPTQHSVAALRSIGITPDAVVCRSDRELPEGVKRKISLMCDVDPEAVVAAVDAPSIYEIPKVLHAEGLDAYVVRRLGLPFRDVDWTVWGDLLDRVHHPKCRGHGRRWSASTSTCPTPTCRSSRRCAPAASRTARRCTSAGCPRTRARPRTGARRRWPAWTASSSPAASASAASRARSARCATPASAASRRSGCASACSAWSSRRPATWPASRGPTPRSSSRTRPHPVIATMASQVAAVAGEADLGGTMRLGAYPATLVAGLGGGRGVRHAPTVSERHRHRYEVNNAYREQLEKAGLVVSGESPGRPAGRVRRAAPRDVHPFYAATQAHPELKSRPTRAHPLFRGVRRRGARLQRRRAAAGRDPGRRPAPGRPGRRHVDGVARPPGIVTSHDATVRSVRRPGRLRRRRVRSRLPRQGDHRCGVDDVRMSDGSTVDRGRRSTIRAPSGSSLSTTTATSCWSTSSAIRSGRASTSCPPACSTSPGSRRSTPPSASWPRRPGWSPTSGTCCSTCTPRPGISNEAIRVFLARGLHDGAGRARLRTRARGAHPDRRARAAGRGGAPRALPASITNAAAVAGLLAAVHGRATGWRDLRPADAPLAGPARPLMRAAVARAARRPRPWSRGYLDHLAVERGVAANTLSSYRRDLDRYLEYLAGPQRRARSTDVDAATVSGFLGLPARGRRRPSGAVGHLGGPGGRRGTRAAPVRAARGPGGGGRLARGPPGRAAAPAAEGDQRRRRRAAARRRRLRPHRAWRCATGRCWSCSTAPARASPRRSGWTSTTST